jgi:hypothetical protein
MFPFDMPTGFLAKEAFARIEALNHMLIRAGAKCCKCNSDGDCYPVVDQFRYVRRATCAKCSHHFCVECHYQSEEFVGFDNRVRPVIATIEQPRDRSSDGLWGWICCGCGRARTIPTDVAPNWNGGFVLQLGKSHCKDDQHTACSTCVCLKKRRDCPPATSIEATFAEHKQQGPDGFWSPFRNSQNAVRGIKTIEYVTEGNGISE